MLDKPALKAAYNAFLNEFGLVPKDVLVGAGGALLMYGLRTTTQDIDVEVEEGIFNSFVSFKEFSESEFTRPDGTGVRVLTHPEHPLVDVHVRGDASSCVIEGVCVYTPLACLEFKEMLNRPKDQEDIFKLKIMIQH